jgi:glycosyltransferase involved in cell wall biosynthesis
MDLNVTICTHNPRKDHLERTLASLAAQDLDRAKWALVIVDNASSNGVCGTLDLAWHPNARVVREDRIGLTMARLRGISESVQELIVFVDDDNVLAPDYLSKLLELVDRYPLLGVIGAGRIEPEFEETPDAALEPYLPMLALRSVEGTHWSNDPGDQLIPWGAGMLVRRAVALRYKELILSDPLKQGLDRSGKALNSCGDDEFSWVACEMGLGKGIFSELVVTHLIGKSRVQREYLLRLAEGHAFSRALLHHLHGRKVRIPLPEASMHRVVQRALRLRVSEMRWEMRRWWSEASFEGTPTERAFHLAYREGLERFRTTVLQRKQ